MQQQKFEAYFRNYVPESIYRKTDEELASDLGALSMGFAS